MQNKRDRALSGPWVLLTLGLGISLVIGCSGSGNGEQSGPSTTGAPVGTATLLPSVKVIDSAKADYLASSTDTTWTLRAPSTIKPGDVLLLQDAAVKVVSVDTSSGQMVLTVTLAQIEDVFSQLHLQQTIDLSNATFTPDPTSSIPATLQPSANTSASVAAPVGGSGTLSLDIPFNRPPWTASLTFRFDGKVSLDYDNSTQTGMTGFLDGTGIIEGNVGLGTQGPTDIDLGEIPLGTLRIPIPLSVVDSLLNAIGIRVVSIQVPITLGAKVKLDVALTLGMQASGQVHTVTTYDPINGFSDSGPTVTGSLDLSGLPTDTAPTAPLKATVEPGLYLRAKPQLVILNSIGSIGADFKVGVFGKGTIETILDSPYVCISLNPVIQGTASGFFKALTLGTIQSPDVTLEVQLGAPFLYPAASGESACNSVLFDNSSYSASQGDGSATITVRRDGDNSQVATVQYATSDGTAVAGRDYTAVSGTLTFNPNDPSEIFSIPILNTPTSQGGTVKLTLSQPSREVSLGTPSTSTLTISSGFDGTYSLVASAAVDPPCPNQWTTVVTGTQVTGTWTATCGGKVVGGANWSGTLSIVSSTSAAITGSGTIFGFSSKDIPNPPPRPFTLMNAYIDTGELCWQGTDPLGIVTLQSCSPKVQ